MKRILIAEDDMIGRRTMKRFLEQYGSCELAVDGLEALHLFSESIRQDKPYDLICLDIMMPQLDGLKTLRAIRDIEAQRQVPEDRQVKVIMTTALNDRKTVMEAYSMGCVGYAWKPIDLDKFVVVLREIGFVGDTEGGTDA
jgi:two-component system chemotaxis response regulator CheY